MTLTPEQEEAALRSCHPLYDSFLNEDYESDREDDDWEEEFSDFESDD